MRALRETTTSPFVSVVLTGRNDDHGGNMLHRLRVCLDTFGKLERIHGLDIELIVVDWNPPQGQPALADAINESTIDLPKVLRFLTVPPIIHEHFSGSQGPPLLQYHAKNAGVRRASGSYVLATNLDIILDHGAASILTGGLNAQSFYRVDRADVPRSVSLDGTLDDRLRFCRRNVLRRYTRHGSFRPRTADWMLDRLALLKRAIFGQTQEQRDSWEASPRLRLHTSAAGDFFLMARSQWEALRGYPELLSHGYVDGLLCYMAQAVGLTEHVTKRAHVYHIDHSNGWQDMDATSRQHRPSMARREYLAWCRRMVETGEPLSVNGTNWGLAGQTLMEVRL